MLKYCGWLRKPAPVDRWFIMVYPMILLGVQPSASSRGARFRWPIHPQYVEIPPKTRAVESLWVQGAFVSAHDLCQRLFLPVQVTLFQTNRL